MDYVNYLEDGGNEISKEHVERVSEGRRWIPVDRHLHVNAANSAVAPSDSSNLHEIIFRGHESR